MMVGRQKIIPVLFGALSLCVAVRADMVPLSPGGAGCQQSLQTGVPADPRLPSLSSSRAGFASTTDLGLLPVGFLPEPNTEGGRASETKPAEILTDGQNSVSLCLYALLSLGLCRSAPFVKKLHFGCIPDWYHCGGPSQIGHSFAISPDCLSPAPVHCFIQPDYTAASEQFSSQYHRRTVVSLWRKSQFTPAVLASRGPPSIG